MLSLTGPQVGPLQSKILRTPLLLNKNRRLETHEVAIQRPSKVTTTLGFGYQRSIHQSQPATPRLREGDSYPISGVGIIM